MKKILLIVAGTMLLTGCNERSQVTTIPSKNLFTIAEMISEGKENITSECNKREFALNCEFLTPDLTNQGRWHHTKLVLYKGREAEMVIDGKAFNLANADTSASAEQEATIFSMNNVDGGRGVIKIVRSDEGKLLSFNVYNYDNKKFAASSIKLK
ncbi:hypothetical protein [uncultured Cedecea sp.]|uniref:hypothetical protein n=1 Tax=uncultured Cedecea sp. TaxID=988762 RepID=UPI002632E46A|nr:hypothetical protein [uncultured Cedecea sp.]